MYRKTDKIAVEYASPAKQRKHKKTPSSMKHTHPEHKMVLKVLKLIDGATDILREGIATGTQQSAQIRSKVRKKAHAMLEQAQDSLKQIMHKSTSSLHKVVDKM